MERTLKRKGQGEKMSFLSISRRTRKTYFSEKVIASGVKAFTVYNRMLLPTVFKSVEEDCRHLKSAVQVWDVSVQRQVEIVGPDANKLVSIITPRSLQNLSSSKCMYIPMVNSRGGMINDPVLIKLSNDRYWVSISDSDVLLWIDGLAQGLGFNVEVFEPDVSTLAVQGPKALTLMERVFGSEITKLSFFGLGYYTFNNTKLLISKSGYSKQGGYEICVTGKQTGIMLWDALFEAGLDLNVRAGGPNLIERVESGLLSYGNDMTSDNTPFECGLGKYLPRVIDELCIGASILNKEDIKQPKQIIRSIAIDASNLPQCTEPWPLLFNKKSVGQITSASYSPDFNTTVAIGMVKMDFSEANTELFLEINEKPYLAMVKDRSFN